MLAANKKVYNKPSLILTTTPRLKEKYIFKKHLGELYFLNRAVKAAEDRQIRAPPVNFSCKAVVSIVLVSMAAVLWKTIRPRKILVYFPAITEEDALFAIKLSGW